MVLSLPFNIVPLVVVTPNHKTIFVTNSKWYFFCYSYANRNVDSGHAGYLPDM